jgi:hypothetical protein
LEPIGSTVQTVEGPQQTAPPEIDWFAPPAYTSQWLNPYRKLTRQAFLAAQHAKAGYYVFRLKPNGKTPAFKGWQDEATNDPARVAELWGTTPYNIGWALWKSGHFAFDLDAKNGKDGIAEWRNLWNGQAPPKCLVNTTTTGGRHLIFKADLPNSAGKLAPGIDTRGTGGYVAAPGSVVDGKTYRLHPG